MRVHLVDGTFELFRAHFAPRPDRPIKATVGLVLSMLALLAEEREAVSHVAIAFDNPIVSFRNELFAGYKTDEGVPPVLRAQFDLAEEAMRALGVAVWSMDRWEADDALATGAVRFGAEPGVTQVRILSPDKDLGQVVRGEAIVQVDRIRKKLIDEPAVRAARGVGPKSVPDLLALVGDPQDGIPGLAGFGAKSAAALLARYGTLEAIPLDAAMWEKDGVKVVSAPRLAATLAAEQEEARLYKRLATLDLEVPLPHDLGGIAFRGGGPRFEAFCAAHDLTPPRSLLAALAKRALPGNLEG